MYTATVTNQNQITIPAKVRALQHIKPGDQVVFTPQKTDNFSFQRLLKPENTFGLLKKIDHGQKYDPHAIWHQDYGSK
jgi:AbrB family looped-hinge helix DNA binding protein